MLAIHQGAGVSKKAKQGRKAVMSSKARKRHEKDLERAEAIMERTALKVQKSKIQARKIQSVKKTWDELNAEMPGTAAGRRKAAGDQESDGDEDQTTDEEMDEGGEHAMAVVQPAAMPLSSAG